MSGMCLAVPAEIVELMDGSAGVVSAGGVRRVVDLSLIDNPVPGEYVIVHAGFAIEKLDTADAEKTLRMLEEIGDAAEEGADG